MAVILSPNDIVAPDVDRFTSMSVTRNRDAVIRSSRNQLTTRASLSSDDIDGARPRSLPPFQRNTFHSTLDIEGAQPKRLHCERRQTPDVLELTTDIPGKIFCILI